MKKIKIVNKKTFAIFIFSILILIGILVFLIFKIIEFKLGSQNIELKNKQNISEEKNSQESDDSSSIKLKNQNLEKNQNQSASSQAYTEYNNQQYEYAITFPDNWYLNSDSSESKTELADIDEKKISIGGQTFWSNYNNIDEFSPMEKPEDFHLLGLTIYEAEEINVDELASILGFDAGSILQKNTFEGKSISGTQFVAGGSDEKNPLVIIIFQKDQRFYVFNLGFPNGSVEAAETMENIAKTLVLK